MSHRSGWRELPHPRAEREPHRRCQALGLTIPESFLLRADEVIDQVPMSACGAKPTSRHVRHVVAIGDKADMWPKWKSGRE
jgi:hypothetical protein